MSMGNIDMKKYFKQTERTCLTTVLNKITIGTKKRSGWNFKYFSIMKHPMA